MSSAHGGRVRREATGTLATAVTARLALGCESGGREAGNKAPDPENPGRTEQSFEGMANAPGRCRQAKPEGRRRRVRSDQAKFTHPSDRPGMITIEYLVARESQPGEGGSYGCPLDAVEYADLTASGFNEHPFDEL